MAQRALEHHVQNLERRVATVEQILPTLATKADLADLRAATKADLADLQAATKADLADLRAATKADLDAAIAPLATKAEVQLASEETRRHFDVVAEGLRDDIRMIAEGVVSLHTHVTAIRAETTGVLANHNRRLTRLETSRPKQR